MHRTLWILILITLMSWDISKPYEMPYRKNIRVFLSPWLVFSKISLQTHNSSQTDGLSISKNRRYKSITFWLWGACKVVIARQNECYGLKKFFKPSQPELDLFFIINFLSSPYVCRHLLVLVMFNVEKQDQEIEGENLKNVTLQSWT